MRGGSTWMENMSSSTISCVQGSGLVGGVLSPHHHAAASPVGGGYIGERPLIHTSAPQSPAQGWHMHPVAATVTVKQETMERDERLGNDSGISSAYTPGSDGFQSSSPGSSDQNSRDSEPPTTIQPTAYSSPANYYNTPTTLDTRYTNGAYNPYYENHMQISTPQTAANNPITPILTSMSDETKSSPTHDRRTPDEHSESEESDHYYKNDGEESLRLQIAIDRHDSLSEQHSPKGSEHNSLEDDKSDYEGEEDEANLRTPRVNSHGKVKIFKCKQCEFVAVTKMDFWEHTRGHIKVEKLLTCPKCPFVTEYKHHLEYHLRNHFGSKPFKCDKCNYSCVNKSMLNSHLKSHSNVYQYRCSDCAYATKYCHSLKLHLRKYGHKPAMVLNPDGSPNPLPIIDVYGTRRGPKQRSSSNQKSEKNEIPPPEKSPPTQTQQQVMPPHSIFPPSHFMLQPNQSAMPLPMPFPFGQLLNAFQGNIPNPLAFSPNNNNNIEKSEMIHNDSEMENSRSPNLQTCDYCDYTASNKDDLNAHLINAHEPLTPKMEIISDDEEMPEVPRPANDPEVLDLSRPDTVTTPSTTDMSVQTPTTPTTKNRRKGRAFKLGHAALQLQHATGSDNEVDPATSQKVPKVDEQQYDSQSIAGESCDEDEPVKNITETIAEKKIRSNTPPATIAATAAVPTIVDAPKKDLTFNCQYCDIVFKDVVMYTMHMGYHGYRDPFTCNMCGEQTEDKLAFFLHIARTSHC